MPIFHQYIRHLDVLEILISDTSLYMHKHSDQTKV